MKMRQFTFPVLPAFACLTAALTPAADAITSASPDGTAVRPPRPGDGDVALVMRERSSLSTPTETIAIPPLPGAESASETTTTPASTISLVILMLLGIGLASAMLYWASKIGRDGYHRTRSNYPVRDDDPNNRPNVETFTTPVP